MAWDDLHEIAKSIADQRISDMMSAERARDFSIETDGLYFDYSKTNMTPQAREALLGLAEEMGLPDARDAMFSGALINETENRAVLHTALRDPDGAPVLVDGQDVKPGIRDGLEQMRRFAEGIRDGSIAPSGGGKFLDIVNIGIGGSDLGPQMAAIALAPYSDGPRLHFASNVDGAHIHDILSELDPMTTLVIIASKTFTTIETMTNAKTASDWLLPVVGQNGLGAHLAAVSTAEDKTSAFGVSPDRVFGFEDWVGGRYSMWGPIGLALMIGIGAARFDTFLAGGRAMDTHFCTAKGDENLPLMLALVGLWHNQVCGYATRAVLPYEQRLSRLPAYLQQLEMESNGKRVAMSGETLDIHSGPVVWGEPGTNGQHAFYQLIHQGSRVIPCEFMVAAEGHEPALAHQHELLVANCLAQSQALMIGRSLDVAMDLMAQRGLQGAEQERQARHRVFPGNRPSTTLIYKKLTPFVLGQLIALYEHRVFVEGVVLGINSFDQWGVELGKELATALGPVVRGQASSDGLDASTATLVNKIHQA